MVEWVGLSQRKSEELMDEHVRPQNIVPLTKRIKCAKSTVDLQASKVTYHQKHFPICAKRDIDQSERSPFAMEIP